MRKRVSVACLCALLGGCMVGPAYEEPELDLPAEWHVNVDYKNQGPNSLAEEAWLDIFRDEDLRELVDRALTNNRQMQVALERIVEARALYLVNRAPVFPTVDLGLLMERENESGLTTDAPELSDELFLGPTVNWELDLWGANRRTGRAAYATYLAEEYGAQAVRLSLIAEVSRAYFELEGIVARLATNYDTIASRERSLAIAEKRFKGGLISKLEVKQAEVELEASRAFIPQAEQQQLVVENRLAILLGEPPQSIGLTSKLEDQHIPVDVAAGLSSALLERRPDIMAAEQRLIAASEAVGVATARLLPNVTLTGGLGYETEEFGDFFDDQGEYWIADLDVVMPLFNAGARRAQVSAAEARFNQARLSYEQIVLEAMAEVSDALNQFYKTGETLEAQLALEAASEEYLVLATKRYRNGVLAYLQVLDAQRQLFDAQIAVSFSRQAQLTSLVALYKALGGGWDPESLPETAARP